MLKVLYFSVYFFHHIPTLRSLPLCYSLPTLLEAWTSLVPQHLREKYTPAEIPILVQPLYIIIHTCTCIVTAYTIVDMYIGDFSSCNVPAQNRYTHEIVFADKIPCIIQILKINSILKRIIHVRRYTYINCVFALIVANVVCVSIQWQWWWYSVTRTG